MWCSCCCKESPAALVARSMELVRSLSISSLIVSATAPRAHCSGLLIAGADGVAAGAGWAEEAGVLIPASDDTPCPDGVQ